MYPNSQEEHEANLNAQGEAEAEAAQDNLFLLHLIDVTWNEANQDKSVPSTAWAKDIIKKAKKTFNVEDHEYRDKVFDSDAFVLTIDLWNALMALPIIHPDDIHEARFHVHAIQNMLLARKYKSDMFLAVEKLNVKS